MLRSTRVGAAPVVYTGIARATACCLYCTPAVPLSDPAPEQVFGQRKGSRTFQRTASACKGPDCHRVLRRTQRHMGKLEGKSVLITGQQGATLLVIAQQFINEGAHVFLMGSGSPELARAFQNVQTGLT